MDAPRAQPICAQEALDLLNCVTESPFDQDKCMRFLHSLRECVLAKVLPKIIAIDYSCSYSFLFSSVREVFQSIVYRSICLIKMI